MTMKYSTDASALRQQKKEPVTYSTRRATLHFCESKPCKVTRTLLSFESPFLEAQVIVIHQSHWRVKPNLNCFWSLLQQA